MKLKIFALFAVSVLLLNTVTLASASYTTIDTKRSRSKKRQVNPLVALLPASDGILTLDVKRFFGTALPKLLSANPKILSEITAKLDDMQSKTGVDIRKFDSVAVGIATKQISAKEIDFDPVVIARGEISAGGLISMVKLASNGNYKEESIAGRTVYIFSAKDAARKNAPIVNNSKISQAIDRTINGFTEEIALTSLDKNTLVFGSSSRVRLTLEGRSKASGNVTGLLNQSAVISFATRTPEGLSNYLPLDNDELGKNINSIRFLSGSMDVLEGSVSLNMMARTIEANQAQGLLETLEGLQMIGKAFLGSSKRADQQVFSRLLDNAKIARAGNDVTLDLSVAQSDINILVGALK